MHTKNYASDSLASSSSRTPIATTLPWPGRTEPIRELTEDSIYDFFLTDDLDYPLFDIFDETPLDQLKNDGQNFSVFHYGLHDKPEFGTTRIDQIHPFKDPLFSGKNESGVLYSKIHSQTVTNSNEKEPWKVNSTIYPLDLNPPMLSLNGGIFSNGAIFPQFQKRNELFDAYLNSNIFLQNGQLFARKQICKKTCKKIQLSMRQNLFKQKFYDFFLFRVKGKTKFGSRLVLKIHRYIMKDAKVPDYKRRHWRCIDKYFQDFAIYQDQIFKTICMKYNEIIQFPELQHIYETKEMY